ncbi:MBL fold metallo-hydrolase [Brenneria sp. 4F2]|nr:MBL fold metallo-hydrolase [Brenneria bubanii]
MLLLLAVVILVIYVWLQQPQYASPDVHPASATPNFRDGRFRNQIEQPIISRNQNYFMLWYRFVFGKDPGAIPASRIPSQKTDLHALNKTDNVIIWMGHSSYFIQMEGLRFLVDPVFSDSASPIPATNTAFKGSNIYTPRDLPEIDYLLITHDHWDHLDYPTIKALRAKIRHVITPTGVGSYFLKWGFSQEKITEGGWFSVVNKDALTIHILPAQHFSGRLLKRNQTLWGSFALITTRHRIYLGGDSGYGPHYKEIAERLGGFDIAVMECGQYDPAWPHVHMTPEQTALAADDLHAQALLPVHHSKFKLAHHRWDGPLERIFQAARNKEWRLMTPRIGEDIAIDDSRQTFSPWWRSL